MSQLLILAHIHAQSIPLATNARLPRFDRIPSRKLALFGLALRFAFRDRSIAIFTEGLGPQKFHGRALLLINQHTQRAPLK